MSQFYVHQITYAGAESEFAVEDADGARLYRCDRFGVRLPDIDVGVTLEPLELGEWRLVDDAGREIGRARLDEPIFARVPSSTLLFAEYPR